MYSRERIIATVSGRHALIVLGIVYVVSAIAWASMEVSAGRSLVTLLVDFSLIAGPGLLLLGGAYRLPETDIHRNFYANVTGWCVGAILVMLGLLTVYHLQPGDGLSDPVESGLILTALASTAGFGVGIHNSRAKTRAFELERYEMTVETVWDGVTTLDADDRFVTVNEAFCEMTGYDRDELIGEPATLILEESTYDRAGELHEQVAAGELDVATLEYELQTAAGGTIPVEARFGPTEFADGTVGGAGVIRDVSERKARERRLERRARQQQVVSALGQLALETDDLDELMDDVTRQVAAALDADYCQVLTLEDDGETLSLRRGVGWQADVVGEATVSTGEDDSLAGYTLTTDEPVVVGDLQTETRFSRPDLLDIHDVRSGICTVIGSSDDTWGLLAVYDTTPFSFTDEDVDFVQSVVNVLSETIERHQYQRELERLVTDLSASNERLEQFAYAASHDLQEPLRMVSSYLQLIERRYEDTLDEDGQEFLEYAVDGADRMRAMVNGLLEYSRVETQGEPFESVDLDAVVADVTDDLTLQIAESNADLEVEELPTVEGDRQQLLQVVQNLLRNAIDYSGDDHPRISITASRNGTDWTVSVSDDGIGIDPGDQDRIFEIFQRLAPHNGQPGSGIGLALCERIIERHGGELWVESTPGEGSTFSFTLPAEDSP